MIAADRIASARAHRIEDEIERRGIKLHGRTERVGPCPVCGGTDRFSINTKKQVFNCRGCGVGGDVIALVQHLDSCSFGEAIATLANDFRTVQPEVRTPPKSGSNNEAEQHRKAHYLWHTRQPLAGSIAETYLRKARGYRGPLPPTLAFLAPRKVEHHPALIACFANCSEPEPGVLKPPPCIESVHLTFLKADGNGKADTDPNKIVVGSPKGRPIVVAPPNDLLALAITEGIEDALAAYQATGLGAWAAGAAGFMPSLADSVPDYIESVTIFAHADKAGQTGARSLAETLHAHGIEVLIEGVQ